MNLTLFLQIFIQMVTHIKRPLSEMVLHIKLKNANNRDLGSKIPLAILWIITDADIFNFKILFKAPVASFPPDPAFFHSPKGSSGS